MTLEFGRTIQFTNIILFSILLFFLRRTTEPSRLSHSVDSFIIFRFSFSGITAITAMKMDHFIKSLLLTMIVVEFPYLQNIQFMFFSLSPRVNIPSRQSTLCLSRQLNSNLHTLTIIPINLVAMFGTLAKNLQWHFKHSNED